MAKLFLSENDSVTLIEAVNVFGSNGNEKVGISTDSEGTFGAGAIIDQGVERVEFSHTLNNYTFQLNGNLLDVNQNGHLAAQISIQGDGTKLAFHDGSADFVLTGLGIGQLGGVFVDANDSKVSGVNLDTFDRSTTGVVGGSGNELVTISATGIDGINNGSDRKEDAGGTDITFDFAQGSYTYEIEDFTQGDVLQFDQGVSFAVNNSSGVDGEVSVTASNSAAGTAVEVKLVGLATALDQTIFSIDTFNNAFGADSLIIV